MKCLFAVAFIISLFSASYACSCTISATEEKRIKDIKYMETIFYGKVVFVGKEQYVSRDQGIKFEKDGETSYQNTKIRQIKFKVLRIWKGTPVEEITVGANAWDSCSLNVGVGDKLLLATDNRKVLTSLSYVGHCSTEVISNFLNKPLLKKVYGEGEIIKPQKAQQNKTSEYILLTIRQFIFLPA